MVARLKLKGIDGRAHKEWNLQAARPTMDYDARYGADKGFNTTNAFVASVYKSLGGK